MRIMYDGIMDDAAIIHRSFPNAEMVAGYVNGIYAWKQSHWNLFPNAVKVQITVNNSNIGHVLDVEQGDATPAQTEAWIRARKAAGIYRPTIYCNLATVPDVRTGTGPYILGKDYDLWVADYNGTTTSPYNDCAAKQYASYANWDVSAVYDDAWPHLHAPSPTPTPAPSKTTVTWASGATYSIANESTTLAGVKALQAGMNKAGLYGSRGLKVDGSFGPTTQTAVRNFQSDTSLSIDGIAGPATRSKLISLHALSSSGSIEI